MEYALAAITRNLPTIAETRITFPIQGEVCPPRECHLGDGGLPGGGIDHTCVVGLLGTTMLPLAGYMRVEREVYHFLQSWELVFVSIALTSRPISLPHVPSVALGDKGQNLILT